MMTRGDSVSLLLSSFSLLSTESRLLFRLTDWMGVDGLVWAIVTLLVSLSHGKSGLSFGESRRFLSFFFLARSSFDRLFLDSSSHDPLSFSFRFLDSPSFDLFSPDGLFFDLLLLVDLSFFRLLFFDVVSLLFFKELLLLSLDS